MIVLLSTAERGERRSAKMKWLQVVPSHDYKSNWGEFCIPIGYHRPANQDCLETVLIQWRGTERSYYTTILPDTAHGTDAAVVNRITRLWWLFWWYPSVPELLILVSWMLGLGRRLQKIVLPKQKIKRAKASFHMVFPTLLIDLLGLESSKSRSQRVGILVVTVWWAFATTHGNTLSKVAFLRAIPKGDENKNRQIVPLI